MNKIYTIGFTKKSAEEFFNILKKNNVKKVIDIRLNNTSQLAGFSKYPDIEFFLKRIIDVEYKHDLMFSPKKETLNNFKRKSITWEEYTKEFYDTMEERKIKDYIMRNYLDEDSICLLCSEESFKNCHRSLVANFFKCVFECEIVHL